MVEEAVKEVSFEGPVEEAAIEAAAIEDGHWECPECGYSCFIARSDCFKCGTYRPLNETFISEGVPQTQLDK